MTVVTIQFSNRIFNSHAPHYCLGTYTEFSQSSTELLNPHTLTTLLLTLHLLTGYKMYPDMEFSWTIPTLVQSNNLSYFFYLFNEVPLKQNNHSPHILLFTYGTFFSNPTEPFCTHRRWSICPTAKDSKIDWKYCQCPELVCKDHSIKTIHIKCDNYKEQSHKTQISFTFTF